MTKISEYVPDPTSREPLRAPAVWTAAAVAVVDILVGYAVPVPDRAAVGIIALVTTLGPLVVWAWGRRRAWSGATVADRDRLRQPEQDPQR
jgi:hypothetical protein